MFDKIHASKTYISKEFLDKKVGFLPQFEKLVFSFSFAVGKENE